MAKGKKYKYKKITLSCLPSKSYSEQGLEVVTRAVTQVVIEVVPPLCVISDD